MSAYYEIDSEGIMSFVWCNDMIAVIPEGVTVIGRCAFSDCQNDVCEIIMPDSVVEIRESAFANLKNLNRINLSRNLKVIGKYAFANCEHLRSIEIPESVEIIGYSAFANNPRLANITCHARHVKYEIFPFPEFKNINIGLMDNHGHLIIGDTLLHYDGNATDVKVPDKVKYIRERAFEGNLQLQRVTIPDSVEVIEKNAFAYCTNLRELIVPDSVEIQGAAFDGCKALADKDGFIFINGELQGYDGKTVKILSIPDGVKRIPDRFAGNAILKLPTHKIRHLVIPDTVEEIGDEAFANNGYLESVTLGKGVRKIGRKAFYMCTNLKQINISDDIEFDELAFAGCRNLSTDDFVIYGDRLACYKGNDIHIVIPDTVKHIDDNAFAGSHINSLDLNRVETVGCCAFKGCYQLMDINFGGCLKMIHWKAFKGVRITDAVFPDSLTYIGSEAFMYCVALECVNLPEYVDKIESFTFDCCTNLKTVNLENIKYIGTCALDLKQLINYTRDDLLNMNATRHYMYSANQNLHYGVLDQLATVEEFNVSEADNSEWVEFLNKNNNRNKDYSLLIKSKRISKLEKLVANGSLEEIKSFLDDNPDIDFTCRALLIACNQREVDVIKLLLDSGCSFNYWLNKSITKRLSDSDGTHGTRKDGFLYCPLYLGLVPGDVRGRLPRPLIKINEIPYFDSDSDRRFSLEERLEIISLITNDSVKTGVVKDDMLMYAFMCNELELADRLIKMGFSLNDVRPGYSPSDGDCGTYVDILKRGKNNKYREFFINSLFFLDSDDRLAVLTSLSKYLKSFRSKITFTFNEFTTFYDDVPVFDFIVKNCRFNNVNVKYAFKRALADRDFRRVKLYLDAGWIKSAQECEKLIVYCLCHDDVEATSILTDYFIHNFTSTEEDSVDELMESLLQESAEVSVQNNWGYRVLPDGTIRINSYKGCGKDVVVPSEIEGRKVTVIGSGAFGFYDSRQKNVDDRKKIRKITIPEGIREIESNAFTRSLGLEEIKIPNTVKKIGEYAFSYCPLLTTVVLPSEIKTIPNGLFSDCTALKEVVIPDSVTSIGKEAFNRCSALINPVVPDSVAIVGPYAFNFCMSITELRFGKSLRMIDIEGISALCFGTHVYIETDVVIVGIREAEYSRMWNNSGSGSGSGNEAIFVHTNRNSSTARQLEALSFIKLVFDD